MSGDSIAMSIIDEIKAAEIELACEFTQSDWEDALIQAWRNSETIGIALNVASKKCSGKYDIGEKLYERAGQLKPPLNRFTPHKTLVRVWIAKNAIYANDALWDGDFKLAKSLLRKCGKSHLKTFRKFKTEIKKEEKQTKVIRARELTKWHDWKTCK